MELIAAASRAIARNDLAAAERALRSYLLTDPGSTRALELSGDVAARRGDADSATAMYQAAIDSTDSPSLPLLQKLTHALMRAGRPFDTMAVLEETTRRFPNDPETRFDLAGLATMVGLPQAAIPSLRWLARHGLGDPDSLLVLADPDRVESDGEMCRKLLARSPQDLRPEFSLAQLDASQLNWEAVAKRLEPVVKRHKDFVPAYTLYGRALIELDDVEGILEWQTAVPSHVESSPEYWIAAAVWSQRQGRHRQASRAFWEALRLDDTSHPEAMTALLLSLNQLGREQEARLVADQITKHSAMRDALKTHLERGGRSQAAALRVAEAMIALGRIWEGEAWARLAVSLTNDPVSDMPQRYLAIRAKLTVDTPWQVPEMMIGKQLDLSDFPLVSWAAARSPETDPVPPAGGQFYFQDEAQQRGWVHTCQIAPQALKQGHWIYQSVGGGVGVIDFDLDGWPDLAAAMLDGKPLQSDSSANRLFRNINGRFVEVTESAGYSDTGFAQGITVGDYNDDGFPDIFDANIGRNRLYRNNGDGTFRDVSQQVGLGGEAWTTSAAIADIDGDGIADLYEAAYCSGPGPYEQPCHNSQGISTCPPLHFDAEQDRVWRGIGDGAFADASQLWMDQSSPGRGLGLVVGMLDERPGLDLYIANDMTVNHLWSGEADANGFRLTDLAAIRGLGFSARSLSQASMGIAAADPDGDGDLDFFITHFSDDHNTYYEQVGPGLWTDRSSQVGLSLPSMKQLGFGTEWVDFDNNGSLELIIANGHVDDVDRTDVSYRMPPQLFDRDSGGRWNEIDRFQLGDYFATDHLGRALATLDLDRDGRTDVAITHLYDPVSLLINRTGGSGRSIGIELKATTSQRDAIGAIVKMKVGTRNVTAQLTAGDGYMCSDQRRLSIGTGTAGEATDVMVTWPSGTNQVFGSLEAGRDYLLIEGSADPYRLQDHQ